MDQVYEIESVRKRCLDLLRAEGRTLSTGELSRALKLPSWAVDAGMDSAAKGRLATFSAGAGWTLFNPEAPRAEEAAEQGGLLL